MAAAGAAGRSVTVGLRTLGASDVAWLDTWLPAVAEGVGYEYGDAPRLKERARNERSFRLRIISRGGADAGLVVYRINTPRRGSALFELVATPAEQARRGAGMMAAALVEEEMRAGGVHTVYAPAAEIHGISMYFWIRLGYSPILRAEWPCAPDGVAWLRRTVA
ncbi:MAG: hypothetical protein HY873_13485 [Chloroflexi bacterium]|nr:hypothetical protein [Chloroflexota bacterium]